jgi:hypothetical protein
VALGVQLVGDSASSEVVALIYDDARRTDNVCATRAADLTLSLGSTVRPLLSPNRAGVFKWTHPAYRLRGVCLCVCLRVIGHGTTYTMC